MNIYLINKIFESLPAMLAGILASLNLFCSFLFSFLSLPSRWRSFA